MVDLDLLKEKTNTALKELLPILQEEEKQLEKAVRRLWQLRRAIDRLRVLLGEIEEEDLDLKKKEGEPRGTIHAGKRSGS